MDHDHLKPQVSGSLTFDTKALGEALIAALKPVLDRIEINIRILAGELSSTAMDENEAVTVLAQHLPAMTSSPWQPDNRAVAGHLAEHLAQAGYVLTAVAGPALEGELARRGIVTGFAEALLDTTDPKRDREDAWFAPERTE